MTVQCIANVVGGFELQAGLRELVDEAAHCRGIETTRMGSPERAHAG
jgi:hypothetical protein